MLRDKGYKEKYNYNNNYIKLYSYDVIRLLILLIKIKQSLLIIYQEKYLI